jgi:hypothetical protein
MLWDDECDNIVIRRRVRLHHAIAGAFTRIQASFAADAVSFSSSGDGSGLILSTNYCSRRSLSKLCRPNICQQIRPPPNISFNARLAMATAWWLVDLYLSCTDDGSWLAPPTVVLGFAAVGPPPRRWLLPPHRWWLLYRFPPHAPFFMAHG